jgi:transcriptional antiterminator NusG
MATSDEPTEQPPETPAPETTAAAAPDSLYQRRWYTVRTYSGHEKKVKEFIEREVERAGIQDKISAVHIPYEKIVEVKNGKKTSKTKNIYPGYVLVEMYLDRQTKSLILDNSSVINFLGVKDNPIPLRADEVKRMLASESESERTSMKVPFEVMSPVKITEGPFNTMTGIVHEINMEKMKVKVMVSIFGRNTPVELDFTQVKPANTV